MNVKKYLSVSIIFLIAGLTNNYIMKKNHVRPLAYELISQNGGELIS